MTSCHPMTEADLKKVAELSKKANDDYSAIMAKACLSHSRR